ncbi:MAG: hypothetical protein JW958_12865 [Candidatus Eisenbacteria bacterium]|nr:hypothetical protein [Candidatus Eisenbacteria bacterium]
MRRIAVFGAALAALLFGASTGGSEEIRLDDPPPFETRLSFALRDWTVKKEGSPDQKALLWTTPLEVRRRIGRVGSVSLLLRDAIASTEGEGKSDYAGLVDARLSGALLLDRGRWRVDLSLGLPTGRAPIEPDEELLAGLMANRLFGFPVKRLGEGFDVGLGGARVFTVPGGPLVSVGAGYLRNGEYDYIETDDGTVRYKPGDEFYLAGGAARGIEAGGIRYDLSGDIRYRRFARDEKNGSAFFDEGDQVDLLGEALLHFPSGRTLDLSAFLLFKGEGSEEGAFAAGDPDSLSLERYLVRGLTGDALELRAEYAHPVSGRLVLLASVAFVDYGEYSGVTTEGERLLGSGRVWRTGGGARLGLGARSALEIRLSGLFGEAEEGAVDLSGLDAFSSLVWEF